MTDNVLDSNILFGLDLFQKQSLNRVVSYIKARKDAGATTFPDVPHYMFFGFDNLEVADIKNALRWIWDNPSEDEEKLPAHLLTNAFADGGFRAMWNMSGRTKHMLGTYTPPPDTPDPPPPPPPVASPYLRLRITETHGGMAPQLARVTFKDAGGNPLTGTVIFSSQSGQLTAAANAFDADASTIWQPNIGDPAWYIGVQLAQAGTCASVEIQQANIESSYTDSSVRSLVVEQSTDNSNWNTVIAKVNIPVSTPAQIRTFS